MNAVGRRALSLADAAIVLGVSPRSLADRRYRTRLGLAARKVGRRLVFMESDVLALLERCREHERGERASLPGRQKP